MVIVNCPYCVISINFVFSQCIDNETSAMLMAVFAVVKRVVISYTLPNFFPLRVNFNPKS